MDNKFSFRRVFLVATLAILVIIMLITLAGRFMEVEQKVEAVVEVEQTSVAELVIPPIMSESDLIRVFSPQTNATVTNPIIINGEARGYWFFEASFPIYVVDWNGLIIGEGYAEAKGDWMTEEFVPFRAVVQYDLPSDTPYKRGALILKKDNPSGLPEYDDALEMPILFE